MEEEEEEDVGEGRNNRENADDDDDDDDDDGPRPAVLDKKAPKCGTNPIGSFVHRFTLKKNLA